MFNNNVISNVLMWKRAQPFAYDYKQNLKKLNKKKYVFSNYQLGIDYEFVVYIF